MERGAYCSGAASPSNDVPGIDETCQLPLQDQHQASPELLTQLSALSTCVEYINELTWAIASTVPMTGIEEQSNTMGYSPVGTLGIPGPHLAQACSSNRFLLEGLKQLMRRRTQLRLNDSHGFSRGKGRHPVLQLGQFICKGGWEQI